MKRLLLDNKMQKTIHGCRGVYITLNSWKILYVNWELHIRKNSESFKPTLVFVIENKVEKESKFVQSFIIIFT